MIQGNTVNGRTIAQQELASLEKCSDSLLLQPGTVCERLGCFHGKLAWLVAISLRRLVCAPREGGYRSPCPNLGSPIDAMFIWGFEPVVWRTF